jgi:hypothetical protein
MNKESIDNDLKNLETAIHLYGFTWIDLLNNEELKDQLYSGATTVEEVKTKFILSLRHGKMVNILASMKDYKLDVETIRGNNYDCIIVDELYHAGAGVGIASKKE